MTKMTSHLSLVEALERESEGAGVAREQAAELVEDFVADAAGDHLDRLLAATAPEVGPAESMTAARRIAHSAETHATVVDREVARFLATENRVRSG